MKTSILFLIVLFQCIFLFIFPKNAIFVCSNLKIFYAMRKYYYYKLMNILKACTLVTFILYYQSSRAQVSLTATVGTASATYTTVSAAFAAINAGTHQGVVVLTITSNTTEPAAPTALLRPAAAGGYTSVKIVPSGNRTIGLSTLNANRGIIELFGARNVEIDGDDPAVAGVDRSLTIGFNTGTASFNNTAVIRIGSVATPSDSAVNITIKNCNITGPRPSTTSTSVNYGVIVGSNSTTNQLTFGIRNSNIILENNNIIRCYNGIGCYSNSTVPANAFSGIRIRNNLIGITTVVNDFVGSMGIDIEGASTASSPIIIEGNSIRVGTNTTSGFNDNTFGLLIRNGNPSAIVRYNKFTDIMNNNSLTGAGGLVAGIFASGAANTNLDIHNNFVKDVVGARKQTGLFLEANYGMYFNGIGSLRVNHNTIALNLPNYVGTGTNTVSAGITFMGTTNLLEFSNNIIVNRNASTNAYCIGTMSNMTPFVNTVLDKNCYYVPNGNISNTAASLAAWQSITGRDQNSFIENPPFVSTNDLHIQTGVLTRIESNAAPSGYAFDIDLDVRPNPTDIGADEFAGTAYQPPVILNVNHTPTAQSCATATARTVQALFSTLGNAVDSVMVEYSVNGGTNQYLRMNSVSALGYTRTLPAVSPLNAILRYRILAITKVGDTVSSNYGYYNDNTASRALMPTLSASPSAACAGSIVPLRYTFLPDPTGFIFPPNVIDTISQTNITNVKLTTIDNTTPASNSLVGSIGTATGSPGAYANFRNFKTDTMGLGRSYPASVSASTTANVKLYMAAFVDFDGDGSFTGANEMVFNTIQARTSGSRTENFNLYIPPNARPGKTCIRFICSQAPIANSFFNINRGEVEDYSIFITPLTTVWKTGVTTIGSGNPQSYTVSAVPSAFYIEMTDSANCNVASNPLNITAATGGLNVTLTAPSKGCYNSPILVTANATGGCPPYTYSWSNNTGLNAASQMITVLTDTINLQVKVTDKNGSEYNATRKIAPNNPRLTSVPPVVIICNRGSTNITVGTAAADSAIWYNSALSSAFEYDFMGRTFTTPVLNETRDFYVAALNSSSDSVGKMNLTGSNTTTLPAPGNAGIQFDVVEPIVLRDCQMYITGNAGATISIALLDKYGSIIAQLNNYALSGLPATVTTPTRIPLNFAIPRPDTAYKLIITGATNLTALTRHTTGFTYPMTTPANRPAIITRSYELGNPSTALNTYYYFYNIRVLKGICVGQKDTVEAKVKEPTVPGLYEDLKFTQICEGSQLLLKVRSQDVWDSIQPNGDTIKYRDTFGDRFVWYRNGIMLPNLAVSPPDSFRDSFYRVTNAIGADTGMYQVKIYSSRFCTRDTFSRVVKVRFYDKPKFLKNLSNVDMCLKRDKTLSVITDNGTNYKWYKDTFKWISTVSGPDLNFTNVGFDTAGFYQVEASNNGCKGTLSNMIRLTVHDTARFLTQSPDTVICESDRYVFEPKTKYAKSYQWYKDNGEMNNFIQEKLTLYSSKVTDSGIYRLKAWSYEGCPIIYSDPVKLVVNPKPIIQGFYPTELKYCVTKKIKLTSSTLNKTGIDWYRDGTVVSTVDSFVAATASLSNAGKYSFVVKGLNKCKDINSDTTNVIVVDTPSVSGSRGAFIECQDTSFRYGFNTINGKIYQWYKNGFPIQDKIDSQIFIQYLSEKDNGQYYVTVNSDPVCSAVTSSKFNIDIKRKPIITLQPVNQSACNGETVQLTANTMYQTGYQWIKDGNVVPGGTSNTLILNGLIGSNSGKYWLRVNAQSPCRSIISDTAIVVHRSGQSNANLSLVSIYNAEEQCTDGDNWTYYATKQEPDKYIFAVNKKGNNIIGSADIVVRPNTFYSVISTGKEYSASLMMKRFWNYKLISGSLTSPIDVKFYISQAEIDDLDAKKDDIKNLYGDDLTQDPKTMRWFKTKDIPFANSLLSGVRGSRFNFDSLVLTEFVDGADNGVKYIIFNDVNELGGGTAYYSFKGGSRILGSVQNGSSILNASISPNPNNGEFNLSVYSKSLGKMDIQIVNNLGQVVYRADLKQTNFEDVHPITVSGLASGLYQLLLNKDDITTTIKLQIEK